MHTFSYLIDVTFKLSYVWIFLYNNYLNTICCFATYSVWMSSDCSAANVFFYQGSRMLIAYGLFLSVQTINVYIHCHSIVSMCDITVDTIHHFLRFLFGIYFFQFKKTLPINGH